MAWTHLPTSTTTTTPASKIELTYVSKYVQKKRLCLALLKHTRYVLFWPYYTGFSVERWGQAVPLCTQWFIFILRPPSETLSLRSGLVIFHNTKKKSHANSDQVFLVTPIHLAGLRCLSTTTQNMIRGAFFCSRDSPIYVPALISVLVFSLCYLKKMNK